MGDIYIGIESDMLDVELRSFFWTFLRVLLKMTVTFRQAFALSKEQVREATPFGTATLIGQYHHITPHATLSRT